MNCKGLSLRDLHVVSELHVLSESESVEGGDDSVRLEVVHAECVTLDNQRGRGRRGRGTSADAVESRRAAVQSTH